MLSSVSMSREILAGATDDAALVAMWLHNRSADTRRAYAGDVRKFLQWIGKSFRQVTLGDLQAFGDSLVHLAPSSRYRTLSALKSLLSFGQRVGYLRFNAGAPLKLPQVRQRLSERILAEEDVLRLLKTEHPGRNRAILMLLYFSGIRVSELCGLRWRDLQAVEDGGQISVLGKGGEVRSIRLPIMVWNTLMDLRPASPGTNTHVFLAARSGRPLQTLAVHRVVRAAAQRAGLEVSVSPHWLRHAHASHSLDRGAPIHLVQATLGHRSIHTTGRYLHARPKESSGRFLVIPD